MKADPSAARLRFDRFELDEAEARLTCAGEPVALAPKPFGVLCALARSTRVPPHDQRVTGQGVGSPVRHGLGTGERRSASYGTALDDDARKPRFIETVSRRGHRFIAATIGASSQRTPAIERSVAAGRDHPAITALTASCRGDAALAELIRAVAATLEREPRAGTQS